MNGGSISIRNSYTIVEMIVVMAIVGVLIGIALPAYNKLIKGQGVELAARNVGAKLKYARAQAIMKRKRIALLFPRGDLPIRYRYQAYRMCIVDDDNNFLCWLPGEKWIFMPTGTAVTEINESSGYSGSMAASQVDNVNCSEINSGASDVDSVPALIFKPTGKIDASAAKYLTIEEGQFNGGSIVRTNSSGKGVDIKIDNYTGRISYGTD